MAQAEQRQSRGSALARLVGSVDDAVLATARLQYAAKAYHLVSPATSCPHIPEGMSLAITSVEVDVEHETHPVGAGKIALGKSALDRVSAALGISWDPRSSGRIDDGSDPHYCAWRAVGVMRGFDGVEVQLIGSKEMDLRPGSPQVVALEEKAAAKGRDASRQIREMRLHIMAHAESKARLRAVRSAGIRSSYDPGELQRPFIVARMMWTGRTDDPELRRAFALKQADAMLGGVRSLYGDAPPAAAAMPAPAPARALAPPPPRERPAAFEAPSAHAAADHATPSPRSIPADSGALTMPYGRAKGTPITEASDGDLSWMAGRTRQKLSDEPDGRYAHKDRELLAALDAEMGARAGGSHGDVIDADFADDEGPF